MLLNKWAILNLFTCPIPFQAWTFQKIMILPVKTYLLIPILNGLT